MCKVGICGHFGRGKKFLNGQTVKTQTLAEELLKNLGRDNIKIVDTYGWKRKPITLIRKCFMLINKCQNIIILPAHNGIRVFPFLFLLLNGLFHKKLHYVVIGGWLPEFLACHNNLKNRLNRFDGIYVETYSMLEKLQKMGLRNIKYLPNFKRLRILDESELIYQNEEPYRLCTFSRVLKEKGIEDAIEAVKNINNTLGRTVYTLDIFGQVDVKYKARFETLKKEFAGYIKYKGEVDYNKAVDVLKNYFLLLFPTHFKTEGVPGTIIDAYSAGIPVIASNWDYANEVIVHNETGLIYEFNSKQGLEQILFDNINYVERINEMKKNCLKRAKQYMPEAVISEFLGYLN